MRDNDLISESSYEELVQTIEEDMDEWQAACSAFISKGTDPAFLGDEDDMAFYDDFDAEPSTGGPAAATTTREDIIQLFTLALTLGEWHEGTVCARELGERLPPAHPVGVWGGLMR